MQRAAAATSRLAASSLKASSSGSAAFVATAARLPSCQQLQPRRNLSTSTSTFNKPTSQQTSPSSKEAFEIPEAPPSALMRSKTASQLKPAPRPSSAAAPASKPPSSTATLARPTSASPTSTSTSSNKLAPSKPSSASSAPTLPPALTGDAPKTLMQRIKGLIATAKFLFKFYWAGLKAIWANRETARRLRERVQLARTEGTLKESETGLTWSETQLLRTHSKDMLKLPLFLAILMILEELLPLVVIYAPGLLPSTCVLPSQLDKIRASDELARAAAIERLRAQKEKLPEEVKIGSSAELTSSTAALRALDRKALADLARVYTLSAWGPSFVLLRRLTKHAEYLVADTQALRAEPSEGWPKDGELVRAVSERGLRASGMEQQKLVETLKTYQDRTAKVNVENPLPALFLPLDLYVEAPLEPLKTLASADDGKGVLTKAMDVVHDVVQEEANKEQKSAPATATAASKAKK